MREFSKLMIAAALAAGVTAPAYATSPLEKMLAGESALQGEQLEKAIEAASVHPFGSKLNPVRAHQANGQRAYLARLRCDDGTALQFRRRGNVGRGPYMNIVDRYQVRCGKDNATLNEIYMDLYHKGYVENASVPGYSIVVANTDEVDKPAPKPEPLPTPQPVPQTVPIPAPVNPASGQQANPADAT